MAPSGSPIFNQCSQLIAVNYAGYEEAQSYIFGIVAKQAIDWLICLIAFRFKSLFL
jgi:hypothetical protein